MRPRYLWIFLMWIWLNVCPSENHRLGGSQYVKTLNAIGAVPQLPTKGFLKPSASAGFRMAVSGRKSYFQFRLVAILCLLWHKEKCFFLSETAILKSTEATGRCARLPQPSKALMLIHSF